LFVSYQFLKIGEATAALSLAVTKILIINYLIVLFVRPTELVGQGIKNSPSRGRFLGFLENSRFSAVPSRKRKLLFMSLGYSLAMYVFWYLIPPSGALRVGAFGGTFLALSIIAPWAFLLFLLVLGSRIPIVTIILLLPFSTDMIYRWIGF